MKTFASGTPVKTS